MVKDHSDSERGNPLPPHGLLFSISSKGSFICIIPQISGGAKGEGGGGSGGAEAVAGGVKGRQFRAEIYFYYTNRGAPGGNNPCSATDKDTTLLYRLLLKVRGNCLRFLSKEIFASADISKFILLRFSN